MKKLLLILALLSLILPGLAEAQDHQLSRDARIDLLEVRALNALNSEDWSLFLENIDELDELGADLGIEVVLFVGRAHFELQQYERSYEKVSDFLEAIGREHPNYVEALSLYDEVSEKLDRQHREFAEEDRLYNRAMNNNSLAAAQQYLRDYPLGRYRKEVLRVADEQTYKDAVRENTYSAIENYINSHPNGSFVNEARKRKITLERETMPDSEGIVLEPNPFSPEGGESKDTLFINYRLYQSDYTLRVRIYDHFGRLVYTLADDIPAGRVGTLNWDGSRNNGQEKLNGIYIVNFEAYNSAVGSDRAFREQVELVGRH